MELERSSGVLLHITSLPSPFDIGDLGPEAYKFIDFLKASGHSYWQLLPLNPTYDKFSHSPYSSDSAFAGNPILISPELLVKEGFIKNEQIKEQKNVSSKVDYSGAGAYKEKIIEAAFRNFQKRSAKPKDYLDFEKKHSSWLSNYALYRALRLKFDKPWDEWPEKYRDRDEKTLKKAKQELSEVIEKKKFIQYLFFSQWDSLIKYAHSQGVQLIGDIPFYINHDSADCWANAHYFKLDGQKKPTKLSGVPPDYFSKTGQLWGTPVYNWKILKENNYDWWVERIRQNLLLFDLVRLDHFRAFAAYWEVPGGDETAENGKWVKTPGTDFFKIVKKEFPEMPLIAEDLGSLDEPVYKLLDRFNFPGMKVLHFAFGEEKRENPYLPFNHIPNGIVYTGTHDNNTSRGWFKNENKVSKHHLQEYSGQKVDSKNVHKVLHRIALNSVAKLAIVPLQDLIGLGEEAIMNIPGSTTGNWTWRATPDQIPVDRAEEFKALNKLYGRIKEEPEEQEKPEKTGSKKKKN